MKIKKAFAITSLLFSLTSFAQTTNVDKIIDSYIVYIQDINMNEVFQPETTQKTFTIDGNQVDLDITYYHLSEKQIFSIIVQSYTEPEVKSTYYVKDNQLIAVFIEENSFSSNPNDKKFRNYFLKENIIILEEPANSSLDYEFFIHLGKGLLNNQTKKQDNKN